MGIIAALKGALSGGRWNDRSIPPPDPEHVKRLRATSLRASDMEKLAANPEFVLFMEDVSEVEKELLELLADSETTKEMIKLKAQLLAVRRIKSIIPDRVDAGKRASTELIELKQGEQDDGEDR